jgi:carbamoyltransferase
VAGRQEESFDRPNRWLQQTKPGCQQARGITDCKACPVRQHADEPHRQRFSSSLRSTAEAPLAARDFVAALPNIASMQAAGIYDQHVARRVNTVVLGLNTAHDAAACLLVDGELVTAVSEERLNRVKSYEGYPGRAVEYCLGAAGLPGLDAVDCVVVNQYIRSDHDTYLKRHGYRGRLIVNPSHHLLHAYYAWVASGFDDAAIMILDGNGYSYGEYERRNQRLLGEAPPYSDMCEAESLYIVDRNQIEVVAKTWSLWHSSSPFYKFESLGHMYSMASQYIFGHWRHAGKTMGLAAYGDASRFPNPIIQRRPDGEAAIDTSWIECLPPRSELPAEQDPVCRDIAAKVQSELEGAILDLADRLHRETGRDRLAISGGVGLNSVTNGRILRESKFSELFITPAAGDAGISIGAALYGHHELTGQLPEWNYRHDFHGRPYTADEVTDALKLRESLVRSSWCGDDTPEQAAADVARGIVVGWFELGSEFGPRSLGHRSILCDPRSPDIRDYLNEHVKFREPFRPYAASVLAEHASDYFDLDVDDPFMLVVANVRPQQAHLVPSIVHRDGTCRIQSVRHDYPGRFRALIEAFYGLTGLPLLLNTSFNIRGEPIIETPGEAIDCFLASNFDVLYLQGHRVAKCTARHAEAPLALVPHLSAGLQLEVRRPTCDGAVAEPTFVVITRTGWRRTTAKAAFQLLSLVDARRSLAEIASEAALSEDETLSTFIQLQEQGLVSFEYGCAALT